MYNLLNAINWGKLGIVIGLVAAISIVFGILIVVVYKLCFVKEDEKATTIMENLAGANCGGCGYAGCADFAKALLEGKAKLKDCGATSKENKAVIYKLLGQEVIEEEKTMAIVKCCGGNNALDKFNYVGNFDCVALSKMQNGQKVCSFACMGAGSCVKDCPFNAISVKDGIAKVNKLICESCGACVLKCPHQVIELIPQKARIYVACSSKCKARDVMNACSTGCIGCGVCAKNCPQGAITMKDNLPIIDYSKCTGCKICLEKCPRKTIKEIN